MVKWTRTLVSSPDSAMFVLCVSMQVAPETQAHGRPSRQVCTVSCWALSCDVRLFDSSLACPLRHCAHSCTVHLFSESAFFKAQADVYNKEAYAIILPP